MKNILKILALLAGLGLFAWFIHRAGPAEILRYVGRLGWWAPLVLLPYGIVYLLDTLGWALAFGRYAEMQPGYWTLFRVRWIGETLNNVVPSGYVGGEALKAYLLGKRGVPPLTAATSVVASKTCQVLAQVIFIGLGALAALPHLDSGSAARRGMWIVTASAAGVIALLFAFQARGMFDGLRALLARLAIRVPALDRHEVQLRRLDQQVFDFYRHDRRRFFASAAAYLAGWLTDALEIFVVCHLLGVPLTWTEAIAIESFITVAKALGIFVPGALGVQESGVALLFHLFGLPAPAAVAYAVIRRGRELFFVLIGALLFSAEEGSMKKWWRQKTA